ncbi:hypothetical protein HAX54_033625, partial [Datura stramonium]|nr:hypothetical protein [Datura stramonium]
MKEQLANNGGNQRDKTPTRGDNIPVGGKQSKERLQREISTSSFINHNSHYPRWSKMEFLRFFGESDLVRRGSCPVELVIYKIQAVHSTTNLERICGSFGEK